MTVTADPIAITSGQINFSQLDPVRVDILSEPQRITAQSLDDEAGLRGLDASFTPAGSQDVPVSGHVLFDAFGTLSFADGRNQIGNISLDLTFHGEPVVPQLLGSGDYIASGPFTLSAQLTSPTFATELSGSGVVTFRFLLLSGQPFRHSATYKFERVVPTSEPGTLLLTILSATGLLGRRRSSSRAGTISRGTPRVR